MTTLKEIIKSEEQCVMVMTAVLDSLLALQEETQRLTQECKTIVEVILTVVPFVRYNVENSIRKRIRRGLENNSNNVDYDEDEDMLTMSSKEQFDSSMTAFSEKSNGQLEDTNDSGQLVFSIEEFILVCQNFCISNSSSSLRPMILLFQKNFIPLDKNFINKKNY